ncbi:RNA methyltransferase, TrmH family [Pseudobutyrivibrio sp. ACV-2]|uniref:TrmH family RNA methyltransferase n=1 Tax=Pseudobutyrivibrio sp. ACV-2 TaxID=1520801 RepID=UPI00089A071E|nr:RNA methyltransferase [Pseudobutyrivibrio sp. ACV-2]SEA95663.1 RNA methyltransferase, TrmH family [Pseudobutyrivibrio sp. ACV-2]
MITSTQNNQIKNIIALNKKARERKAQRLFVVEGIRAVAEVPAQLLHAVYYVEGFGGTSDGQAFIADINSKAPSANIEEVAKSVFNSMSDTVTPQGVLALVKMQDFTLSDVLGVSANRPAHIVIMESLQDPGNMGTIIRTAEGAGATGIIMNTTTVDIYSPKVVRSTMGSIFRVPHIIVSDLGDTIEKLKADHGVHVYAAHLKGKKFHDEFDYTGPTAFMIGNEGNGLTDEMASHASSYLKIPMEGQLESLNASVAASILMYETQRQRRFQ